MASKSVGGVVGSKVVIANLHKQINGIKHRSHRGVLAAALKVQRWSQQKTPVDTGNLRASHSTRLLPSVNPAARISVNAAYASYVHEDLEVHHDNGEAKFLENAMLENRKEILDTIREHARIKKVGR